MASIGDALIFGIPIILAGILIIAFINEAFFVVVASMTPHDLNSFYWDHFNGRCFTKENSTETFCKSDFGFLGIKQWVDDRDYKILEALVQQNSTVMEKP